MASLALRIEGMYCDHCAQTVAHAIGALAVAAVALAGTGVNAAFGYNVFNAIPTIDATISLGTLVVTGVMTSLHCVSMCGAVNLAATRTRCLRGRSCERSDAVRPPAGDAAVRALHRRRGERGRIDVPVLPGGGWGAAADPASSQGAWASGRQTSPARWQ